MTDPYSQPEGGFSKLIYELELAAYPILRRMRGSAARDFAYMTDSSTDSALERHEQVIPARADFGPFRGRRTV